MNHTILIADDEKHTREGLKWLLEDYGAEVLTAADGEEAIETLRVRDIDLLISDLKMPRMDGLELLEQARRDAPDTEVILLTAHGSVPSAVEAMKQGALDYLTKPVEPENLTRAVERALSTRELKRENRALHEELDVRYGFDNIIGASKAMEDIFRRVRQVAPSRASVLIGGESGTGKELIASAIHYNSPRKDQPFIRINCGALTETLLESELFGHEAGAFTHAIKQKPGAFELADGGSLLLDEIAETTPEFQVKLLRVLQDGEIRRVGGVKPIRVNVRIIAATNRDIEADVREARFREDLYYRLNVVRIDMPPLRERREDIPLLAHAFLREFCEENGKPEMRIAPRAMALMQNHDWPGNVRQLRNLLEGLVVMSSSDEIQPRNLPPEIRQSRDVGPSVTISIGASIADAEKQLIEATLRATEGNRAKTARVLGIGRKTLYRKLEEYGLE